MSAVAPTPAFPRLPLFSAALLILATFALVIDARVTGSKATLVEPGQAVASRDLHFADRSDGYVVVTDARGGQVVGLVPPSATDGFVRATMRGLARDRRSRDIGESIPFRLTAHADGALTLEDLATGQVVSLEAFGHTNAESFAKFLTLPTTSASETPRWANPVNGRETR